MAQRVIAGTTSWRSSVQVGDLIKFTHIAKPEENDIGMITDVDEKGNNLMIYWAKTGSTSSKARAILAHPQSFEVISASR